MIPLHKGTLIAFAYGATSVALVLFNKAIFSYFHFGFPLSLFVVQMAISLTFLRLFRTRLGIPKSEMTVVKLFAPMSLCWWLYGVSGVIALKYLTVPTFGALRRLTPLVVMVGEYFILNKRMAWKNTLAAACMSLAGAATSFTDKGSTFTGVMWVSVCVVATAAYLVLIAKLGKPSDLNSFGLLWYNNLIALPFMLTTWGMSEESENVWQAEQLASPVFLVFFIVAAAQALLLNYLIFLCTLTNSPLTTAITGLAKDLVTTIIGLFMFEDVVISTDNLIALTVAFLCGAWYSILKYNEEASRAQVAKDVDDEDRETGLPLVERDSTSLRRSSSEGDNLIEEKPKV